MNYSLILQNNITKEVRIFNLENINPSNSIYYKFDIRLPDDFQDGEYSYLLFENPNKLDVLININNINDTKIYDGSILVTYNEILTENTNILIAGFPIPVCGSGLLAVGEYHSDIYQYNKQNKYTSYYEREN